VVFEQPSFLAISASVAVPSKAMAADVQSFLFGIQAVVLGARWKQQKCPPQNSTAKVEWDREATAGKCSGLQTECRKNRNSSEIFEWVKRSE
jgi:hypothetical protein